MTCQRYSLTGTEMFRCLQVSHYLRQLSPGGSFSECTVFEELCRNRNYQWGLISTIYQFLRSHEFKTPCTHWYMVQWAQDFQVEISWEYWKTIWTNAMNTSLCTISKENIYKVIFR
ncbi:hypothetical protein FKM82_020661 [Ascaphus truei]